MSGKDKQHQEYAARRKDLKALGLQAMESEGKLVFAAVLNPVTVYSPDACVAPGHRRHPLASDPRPVSDLTRLYTLESFLVGSSCCATKKRRQGSEHILCGSVPLDGLDFCVTHHKFPVTQPARVIRPTEWEGFRFAVGNETEGVRWYQPLADAHVAQHFAMLGIVPKRRSSI
jgi:hypothetical protein